LLVIFPNIIKPEKIDIKRRLPSLLLEKIRESIYGYKEESLNPAKKNTVQEFSGRIENVEPV
jgi:hypothetical protein